jgi:hypothetical protein
MPIFRINGKIVYFAHIPKCAGTTVEASLKNCGYKISFHDSNQFEKNQNAWHKSAPQHILENQLKILFDKSFFDYRFAVVRHPLNRFRSAYNYNRYRIGRTVSVARFLSKIEKSLGGKDEYLKATLGHHFFPSVSFLADDIKVYYLEDGIESIFMQISKDLSADIFPSKEENKLKYDKIFLRGSPFVKRLKRTFFPPSPTVDSLNVDDLLRIERLYAADFKALRYEQQSP